MRRFLLSLVLLLLPAPAFAQDAPPTQDTRRILVVGDQLAGGMGAGLTRMSQDGGAVIVTNRFNEASGLTRPEIYDWAAAIPKIAEGKDFNTAFVLIGLNDRRDMSDGDKTLKFGTPEWDALYKTRIDGVIDVLKASSMQVFWMGQPPMGDPGLDADMQNLTALVKDRAAAKGATFIDIRSPFLDASGGYTDRGPDENGTDRRLRESDGVTFFKIGNNRLGKIGLDAMKNGAPAAATAAAPEQQPAADVIAPVEDTNGPIFGQQDANGATVSTVGKVVAEAVAVDTANKAADSASTIGIGAAKGSNAEVLFTTGIAAPAPAGRFDDLSASGE